MTLLVDVSYLEVFALGSLVHESKEDDENENDDQPIFYLRVERNNY